MEITRKAIKAFFIFLTVPVALLFLLACASSYINPNTFWFSGVASLMLSYLAVVLLLAIIFWLVMKPLLSLVPLLSLLIGWQQLGTILSLKFNTMLTSDLSVSKGIRIVSWNVGSMYGVSNDNLVKN